MTEADRKARFTALYDTYHPRVYAYAVSRIGRAAADEIVSETFLVAWRRLDDIPPNELPWLLGVSRNILREQMRAQVRDRSLAAEQRVRSTGSFVDDIADHVAERDQVLSAFATLSGDDRELLTLVAWHGLTAKEAACVVGCSTATYSVRLHRARRRLERALAGVPGTHLTVPTMETASR